LLSSADDSILEYLLPYAHIAEDGYIKGLDRLREESYIVDSTLSDLDEKSLKEYWESFTQFRDQFRLTHDNLARLPASETRDECLADYDHLSEKIDQFRRDIEVSLHRKVSLLSLRESQQSIKEAEAVRRLSQLAFVFIPLTFVTSCFGMNMDVLGSGSGKLSTFFSVASSVTIAALLLPLVYSIYRTTIRDVIEQNTRPLRIIAKLARYFPATAFRLLCYGTRHPGKIGSFLIEMGLYNKLLRDDDFMEIYNFDPPESLGLSPDWYNIGRETFDFFRTRGWKRKTAWRRWRQSRKQSRSTA